MPIAALATYIEQTRLIVHIASGRGEIVASQLGAMNTAFIHDLPAAAPVVASGELWLAGNAQQLLPWLDGLWLAGVLVLALRALGGWWQLERLRRRARTAVPPAVAASFQHVSAQLRLGRTVALRVSDEVISPLAMGVWHAAVILPASAILQLAPEQLEAVLAHELAHSAAGTSSATCCRPPSNACCSSTPLSGGSAIAPAICARSAATRSPRAAATIPSSTPKLCSSLKKHERKTSTSPWPSKAATEICSFASAKFSEKESIWNAHPPVVFASSSSEPSCSPCCSAPAPPAVSSSRIWESPQALPTVRASSPSPHPKPRPRRPPPLASQTSHPAPQSNRHRKPHPIRSRRSLSPHPLLSRTTTPPTAAVCSTCSR